MKNVTEIMNAAINQEKIERQQAEKEVKEENLEAIVLYFGNDAGLEKVVGSFGVDYSTLSVDASNGLLCILSDAHKQWENTPCDKEGPTPEQDKAMDDILMTTACDIIRFFKKENINYSL
jgi:hypothetical protein